MKEVVKVHWVDSTLHEDLPAWASEDDIKGDGKRIDITSVGFLVCKDDNYLYLAISWDNEVEKASCIKAIPHGCISKIERLDAETDEKNQIKMDLT